MAKAARKGATEDGAAKAGNGESIYAYFRRIFEENPELLRSRSNEELLQRWLNDHPGYTEVPQNVKNGLANAKSVMRKKLGIGRRRRRRKVEAAAKVETPAAPAVERRAPTTFHSRLENLEELIDESLTLAKNIDREALKDIIKLLHRARNEVVWKLGQ
jgi:hypothetical protein